MAPEIVLYQLACATFQHVAHVVKLLNTQCLIRICFNLVSSGNIPSSTVMQQPSKLISISYTKKNMLILKNVLILAEYELHATSSRHIA